MFSSVSTLQKEDLKSASKICKDVTGFVPNFQVSCAFSHLGVISRSGD